jgi:phosphate transport system protein
VAAAGDEFAEQIDRLADDTTELGLSAEEVFKNAAAALYAHEPEAALGALAGAQTCEEQHHDINARALGLLAKHPSGSDALRRIVEAQRIAAQFAQIARLGREIADHALALRGTAEEDLFALGDDVPMLLIRMLRQTYVEVRAGVVACTTRDTVIAKRIVSEDGELGRLYLFYRTRLERAIAADAAAAPRLTRILLVGARLHNIGTAVVGIARTVLYSSPQAEG